MRGLNLMIRSEFVRRFVKRKLRSKHRLRIGASGLSLIVAAAVGAQTVVGALGAAAAIEPLSAETVSNSGCLECHADPDLTVTNASGRVLSLFVDVRRLAASCHASNTCVSCHAAVTAQHPDDGANPGPVDCGACHADASESYARSAHGQVRRGSSAAAVRCADCHGVHGILPVSDPGSSIHRANLVRTCRQCHPGASPKFALGRIHLEETSSGELGHVVNRWVRRFYIVLIVLTGSILLAHNVLFWLRSRLTAHRPCGPMVLRMSLNHRLQHFILALSFVVLAASGFALKFPDSWGAGWIGADESIGRWSHRVAALVLIGVCFYHLLHVAFTREGRQLVRDLWPRKRDLADLCHNGRYALGREPHRARFPRFGYIEKFEYWAVVWGTIIMTVTGLVLWFPVEVTRFLPRGVIEVATTVHFYEAILACLAILIWHFYHVIFDPDVYPLNWAFLNGRVPLEYHRNHCDGEEDRGPRPG